MIVTHRHHITQDVLHLFMRAIPACLIFCWVCFSHTLNIIPSFAPFWPPLSFAIVFFCATYAPRLLPYSALIILGILHDALALQPIALTAIQCVALRILVTTQGRLLISLPFWMQWVVFSMAALTLLLSQWIFMGLTLSAAFPLSFAFLPWLSVTALYPLIHRILYPIYHRITIHEKIKQGWS